MNNRNSVNYSSRSGKYRNLEPEGPVQPGFWDMMTVAREIFLNSAARAPQGRLPEVRPDLAGLLTPGPKLKFIWFGHSTLLINMNGQTILIDPIFSASASPLGIISNRFQAPLLSPGQLPPVDTILISHDHYDHLDKRTIKAFMAAPTRFLVPAGVGRHLRSWGLPAARIDELDWGESVANQGLTYQAAPARHFSGRGPGGFNKTLWASWIISSPAEKIYYSGDSAYCQHFQEIGGDSGPFDLAFMENGQYDRRWPDSHMMPEDTVQAVIDLRAQVFVPVHWGMFDLSLHHWADPIRRCFREASQRHLAIITPRLGELVDIADPRCYPQWWELDLEECISGDKAAIK